jgi:hypothetical protein
VDGRKYGLPIFDLMEWLVTPDVWEETNKLEFPIHEDYDSERNKIPKEVMNFLEEKRKVWMPIPIGFTTDNKEVKYVYEDFVMEVNDFMKQQQKTFFAYDESKLSKSIY